MDEPTQLAEMVEALKQVGPELVILDVLNVLHSQDENDNTEMRKVMDCADVLHRELKATICILHHFNKAEHGRLTGRMRGASAIAGWAEWVIGLGFASDKEGEKVRTMQCELKAAESRDPIHFLIETEAGRSELRVVDYVPEKNGRARVDELVSQAGGKS